MSAGGVATPVKKVPGVVASGSNEVEHIKDRSDYLRGALVESFADGLTSAIPEAETQLIKFHGTYQQDDRDVRNVRLEKKLEPAYSFMIRVRMPGGDLSAAQWLKMDRISDTWGNGTIKLSSRQAVQFHGIIKFDLKQTIQAMNDVLLDSIAACGDVNRNVMCSPNAALSPIHAQVFPWAERLSMHLLPQTRAYHEIWLDEGKGQGRQLVAGGHADEDVVEPLYGKHYLPRKFKIGVAIPPDNDMDIYTNCLGYIAIAEGDRLVGFNVTVGGGLGMTFGRDDTFPRLADTIGFCTPEQMLEVAYRVVEIQRDFGNREDRKLSRFKYTVEKFGVEWLRQELHNRLGYELAPARPVMFTRSGDRYGWQQADDGKWTALLYVEHGRIRDRDDYPQKSALKAIASTGLCRFRLSGNQNLLLTDVEEGNRAEIDDILSAHGLSADAGELSGLLRNSIACVSMNTCPLAMAEAERYLPALISKLEPSLEKHGLREEEIKIRMTGCPNGCGRSVMGEIGFIGKSPGRYNMYLGSSHEGDRLNKLYRENLDEAQILTLLDEAFADFATHRLSGERFGDFVVRQGYVTATLKGADFHK